MKIDKDIYKPYYLLSEILGFNLKDILDNYDENNGETIGEYIYYYISDMENTYFSNFNTLGYTKGIKRMLESNGIYIEKEIDFEDFNKKEEYYNDSLIDILLASVDDVLREKYNKTIYGINVGYTSVIYIISTEDEYLKLKNIDNSIMSIFDTEFLEKSYKEIYILDDNIEHDAYVLKGDYLEKISENEYATLYNHLYKKNVILSNLNDNQIKKLSIIL